MRTCLSWSCCALQSLSVTDVAVIWFTAPPSALRWLALGVFHLRPGTRRSEDRLEPSLMSFSSPTETRSGHRLVRAGKPAQSGSSHEVLCPFSVRGSGVGTDVRLPTGHLPSSAFRRPVRVWSSMIPAALFHAADALGVPSPSELFPSEWLYRARRSAIPSRCFPRRRSEDPCRSHPQGFMHIESPYHVSGLLQPDTGRCSLGVSPSSRHSSCWLERLTATIRS
jgi:hypothetical protein